MSSSSLSSRGYFGLTLISLNRITYIPFCATSNTWFMRWTNGTSCGGTYALTTYHFRNPGVSKKFATFGTKLTMPSTCHHVYSLQTTYSPPRCLLSASVAQTDYPSP